MFNFRQDVSILLINFLKHLINKFLRKLSFFSPNIITNNYKTLGLKCSIYLPRNRDNININKNSN